MRATAATCTSCIKGGRGHLGAQKRTADTQSPTTSGRKARRQHETEADAEAGMLSGISRKRSIRSNPCWFTEFCKSQCLSHFAAPFIVVRAETSIAESCKQSIHHVAVTADRAVRAQPAKGVREDRRLAGDSAPTTEAISVSSDSHTMVPVSLAALEQRCSACEAKREPALESSTVRGVDC